MPEEFRYYAEVLIDDFANKRLTGLHAILNIIIGQFTFSKVDGEYLDIEVVDKRKWKHHQNYSN